jgi:uncharacterized membrane protein
MTTDQIKADIELLKDRLLERKPEKFSTMDIARAFFGALVIGATFVFTSGLISVVKNITWTNVCIVIISTIALLIAEIYFIGWSRVKGEKGRNVYEFTLKRLPMFYIISILVSLFYIYIFGINRLVLPAEAAKLIFLIAMPCSIGAAIGDLLKKY